MQKCKPEVIPVILGSMVGERKKILAKGMVNGYIEKPIEPFTIIEEIWGEN